MARSDMPDYYEILGVQRDAGDVEIKQAYRQLSRSAHPDAGGHQALFHMIALAYDNLKDAPSRAAYDKSLTSNPSNGYDDEDLATALAEHERLLRSRWEADTLRWATEQAIAGQRSVPGPVQAPQPQLLEDQEKRFRRLRALCYAVTGAIFAVAYVLRSLDLFESLDPGDGPVHAVRSALAEGFDPVLLVVAVGVGLGLEHFLSPALRAFTTAQPGMRRFAFALLFWIPVIGEYLFTTAGQVVAVLGVATFLFPLLLPVSVRTLPHRTLRNVLPSRRNLA